MELILKKGKKKTKYTIPTQWNELTLGRYMRLMKVLKSDEKIHEIEKIVRILNCLTDVPKRDFYGLDMKSINRLSNHLTEFLNTEAEQELTTFITINDIEYGFHPKLVDMTLGEFVDLETYMKDINENLHLIMSVLYRPVIAKEGDTYAIEDYEPNEDVANLFKKELTLKEFNGASVFFYDLERELTIHSLKSLIQKHKTKIQGTKTKKE